jgi:NAD(P)-dependent dehydrogenase (short-subunit alcohol dehydrogenase family)
MPGDSYEKRKVWFITGSSTGLGRALTEELLKQGYRVAATARNPAVLLPVKQKFGELVITPQLDVTHPDQVRSAVQETMSHFGGIDVVVNNAGYGLIGAIEEVTDPEIRDQFETNFFGALDVIRAVLPVFRKVRSGHFLNVSSIAGFRGNAGSGLYNATKFALEGLSEALAKEAAPAGVRITIVEPGPFRTDFGGRSIHITGKVIDDYVSTAGQMRSYYQNVHGRQAGDPVKAALAMIQAAESDNPPLRLPLGQMTLDGMRHKIAQVQQDLADWEDIAIHSSFDETDKNQKP